MQITKEVTSKKNGFHARRIVSTADLPLKKSSPRAATAKDMQTKMRPTRLEVEIVDLATIATWQLPECQRPLTVSPRVRAVAGDIAHNKGHIPDIITIGICNGQKYLLDGQHRCHAYRIAVDTLGMKDEGIAEVRYINFDSVEEMGPHFAKLNSPLVRMKPDDFLRSLETSLPPLAYIRKHAPFVGYGNVRRGKNPTTCISMSVVLRMWRGASTDTPINCSTTAQDLGKSFTMEEAKECCDFLNMCMDAWSRAPEYARLWSPLNMVLCAWIYRRLASEKARKSANPNKWTLFNQEEFTKCLMALSAKADYLSWLVGRTITEFDRGPCYDRIKRYIQARVKAELKGKGAKLPDPDWASSSVRRRSR